MTDDTQAAEQPMDSADRDAETTNSLEAEIAAVEARVREELQADQMRLHAEMDNLRKRLAREMEQARKFAIERFAENLLQVADSLEKGLEVPDATAEQLREGSELTLKLLLKTLGEHGVEQIHPLGEKFDPERHEALAMQPSEDAEAETVLQVIQIGYALNGRLVRPARVIVAR